MSVETIKPVMKPKKQKQKPLEVLEDGRIIWARNAAGRPICNSPKRNQPGKYCQQSKSLYFNGRCRIHGGTTPGGIACVNFKHGQKSRYAHLLNSKSRDVFAALLAEDEYISLREEIALARMRLIDAINTYGDLDPNALRDLAAEAEFSEEMLAGEYDEDDTERQLRAMIEKAFVVIARAKAGSEVERRQDIVRRLAETEIKRTTQNVESMPAAKVLLLFQFVISSIRLHFKAMEQFLETYHTHVSKDERLPNPLRLIAADIQPLLPVKKADVIDAEVKE